MILDQPKRSAGDGKNEGQFKHGWSGTKTYCAWNDMKDRCYNPNAKHFAHYGGRGINVCDKWKSFLGFLEDMGPRPEGLSLDRIDNNGVYEPANCRWTSDKVQRENRRCTIWVDYRGQHLSLADACALAGVKRHAAYIRIKRGWPADKAIETPFLMGRNQWK